MGDSATNPGFGESLRFSVQDAKENALNEKSAAVFADRRANYTHRRKGVFNVQIIEDLQRGGNVRPRTDLKSCFLKCHPPQIYFAQLFQSIRCGRNHSSYVLRFACFPFELANETACAAAFDIGPCFLVTRLRNPGELMAHALLFNSLAAMSERSSFLHVDPVIRL